MTHTLNYFHLFSLLLYLGIGIALVVIGTDKSWTSVTALGGVLVGFSVIFLGIYIYYKHYPESRKMRSALTMHPGFFTGAKNFLRGKKKKGDSGVNRDVIFEEVKLRKGGNGVVVQGTSGPLYEEIQTGPNPPFDPVYEGIPFDTTYENPIVLHNPDEGSRVSEAIRPLKEAVQDQIAIRPLIEAVENFNRQKRQSRI